MRMTSAPRLISISVFACRDFSRETRSFVFSREEMAGGGGGGKEKDREREREREKEREREREREVCRRIQQLIGADDLYHITLCTYTAHTTANNKYT